MKKKRIVGIDFGLKRIGVAVSDEMGWFARNLFLFPAHKKMEKTVSSLLILLQEAEVKEHFVIGKVVIGLPLKLSGEKSFLSEEVERFIALWQSLSSIPIIPWDERLTTSQVDRMLREEAGLTRKKRAQMVDLMTARLIIETYLAFEKEQGES